MRINSIEIQNFKAFEDASFSFDPHFTVLIGDNGTGKTSLLDALSFALGTFILGINGAETRRPLKESEKRRIIVSPESYEIQLPFSIRVEQVLDKEIYMWCRSTNKAAGGATSYKEATTLINAAKKITEDIRNGLQTSLPLIAYYGTERLSNEKLQRTAYAKESSRLDGYYSALDPRSFQQKFLLWYKTYEDSILKFKKDKALYNAFVETITTMIPEWVDCKFSWETNDLMGQISESEWVSYSTLSSGYQNIIRLSADIAYRAIKLNPHLGRDAVKKTSGVVLIDELDMHLHPKWQKGIISSLKKCFPLVQFIVTTHSPFVIQSAKANEVINLERELVEDPSMKSIEDISEEEMLVEEVTRSNRFLQMQALAQQYFSLVQQGKRSTQDHDLRQIKKKLDDIELEFNDDPVYVALMKAERKSELPDEAC